LQSKSQRHNQQQPGKHAGNVADAYGVANGLHCVKTEKPPNLGG